jgi:hypothetical protein
MGRGLGRRHRTLQRQAVFVEEHHAPYIVAGPDDLRAGRASSSRAKSAVQSRPSIVQRSVSMRKLYRSCLQLG